MKPQFIKHPLSDILSVNKIVTFHYFEFDYAFTFEGEKHDFWELVYVDGGVLDAVGGEHTYRLEPGDCLFHKPNEFHSLKTDGKHGANALVISFVCRSQAMQFFRERRLRVPETLKPLMTALVDEAFSAFVLPMKMKEDSLVPNPEAPIGGQQMIRNYLELFLIQLIRQEGERPKDRLFLSKESMENHLVNTVMERLRDFENEQSIDEICQSLNYSRAYLSRLFKENCRMTMSEYRLHVKIREAKRLIREKDRTVAQIADYLHFSDPHYFSRMFKKSTGMSPSEYRRSVRR